MKNLTGIKNRIVGSRYFSFGITLTLFVVLYAVGMMNYRGFLKPQVFCNLLIDNAALIIATIGITFVLLIGGSWKKISMFLVAVICAGIIGATGGLGFIEAIKGPYMDGFTDFVKSWAVIIALGALLGSLYGKSGAAWRIGDVLIAKAGSSLALLVYVLVGALLVYCGIAVPVTLFVLLPFAKVIFPRAGIPRAGFLYPNYTRFPIQKARNSM